MFSSFVWPAVLGTLKPAGVEGFYPRNIDYAGVFNDDDGDYLSATPSVGDRKKWSFSTWVKSGSLPATIHALFNCDDAGGDFTSIGFIAATKQLYIYSNVNPNDYSRYWPASYRDPTSWMHILFISDTAQADESNRWILYINGVEITGYADTHGTVPQNFEGMINTNNPHYINYYPGGLTVGDCYLSETISLEGAAASPTDFGETKNGVWVPKTSLSLVYGTNGFYLDFANPGADLGDDASGNGNDFARNGTPEQVTDTPTNNFPTIAAIGVCNNTNLVLSEGALKGDKVGAGWAGSKITMPLPDKGQWYIEFKTIEATDGDHAFAFGIYDHTLTEADETDHSLVTGGQSIYASGDTTFFDELVTTFTNVAETWGVGEIGSLAIDLDNDKIWVGKSNSYYDSAGGSTGNPSTGANPVVSGLLAGFKAFRLATYDMAVKLHFGGGEPLTSGGNADENGYGDFEYAPPSGFLALCSANIAASLTILDSIDQPGEAVYVNTRLGTGAEATISDVLFDVSAGAMVANKNRDAGDDPADEWKATDTVRGATEHISFDKNAIQAAEAQGVKSFTGSGFVLGTSDGYNTNGENFLDWVLREGAVYGFDIKTYTGDGGNQTIPHNLGVDPSLIILHCLTNATSWPVYHSLSASDPETDYGLLDFNDAFSDVATIWNDTAPDATNFYVGSDNSVNKDTETFVAYLFADIPGLCKAFAYVGNVNADGPYILLGLKSATFFIKEVALADSWLFYNGVTQVYNPVETKTLKLDLPGAEATTGPIDILSQGLKIRDVDGDYNTDGVLYVGFAWAEQFGCYSNAR